VLASVLSAVMTLFGIFGILFALTLRYALPLLDRAAGHVVDYRSEGGALLIREDTPNAVSKYREDARNVCSDTESSDGHIRVITGAEEGLREEDTDGATKTPLWHADHPSLPQLVPSSVDEPNLIDPPTSAAAAAAVDSERNPLSPTRIPPVALASPSQPSSLRRSLVAASGSSDAQAAGAASPTTPESASHAPIDRPGSVSALPLGRLRLPKLAAVANSSAPVPPP